MNQITKIDFHQKAYVCIEVFRGERPVLLVSREDGDWCFLCGADHPDDASFYRVAGIGHRHRTKSGRDGDLGSRPE